MSVARTIAEGILISACYGAVFLLLWFCSIDQWYLPAGLRIVTLMFRPYREWPFLLMGDAGAMLWLRLPMAESMGYSYYWVYLSPVLHAPMVALAVYAVRRYLPGVLHDYSKLLPATLGLALVNAGCSIFLNFALSGPEVDPIGTHLLRYGSGAYQGVFVILLSALLTRQQGSADSSRDMACAVIYTLVLYFIQGFAEEGGLRYLLRMGFLVPVVVLTFRHGWRGTALGGLMSCIALELSIPRVHQVGYYYPYVYHVQLLHGALVTLLFVFSARFAHASMRSDQRHPARGSGLDAARAGYLAAEQSLRNRVVDYSDLNVYLNRTRKDIVADLRSRGHHSAAMEVTRLGVIESQLLQEYVSALYPLEIETHGFYQALRLQSHGRLCERKVDHVLKGECRALSLGLQLAAYRCTFNAIDALPACDRYAVQARSGCVHGIQGAMIRVSCNAASLDTVPCNEAEAELCTRLEAYGGLYRRRHTHAISFLIAEPCHVTAAARSAKSPLLVAAEHAR